MIARAIAMILALTFSACGARQCGVDLHSIAQARYPSGRYMTAVAEAGTLVAASADAKRSLSARIRSEVESTVETYFEEHNAKVEEVTRIQTRERTDFQHGELLRIADALTDCCGGQCRALAVLGRREASAVLTKEADALGVKLRRAAAAAQAEVDIVRFTPHYRVATDLWPALRSLYFQIWAVRAKRPTDRDADWAVHDALENQRALLLRKQTVRINVQGLDKEPAAILDKALSDGLTGLGLATTGARPTFRFRLVGSVRCHGGAVGPVCELDASAQLVRADNDDVVTEIRLEDAKLAGAHTKWEDTARRDLARRIAAAPWTHVLAAQLAPYLPVLAPSAP